MTDTCVDSRLEAFADGASAAVWTWPLAVHANGLWSSQSCPNKLKHTADIDVAICGAHSDQLLGSGADMRCHCEFCAAEYPALLMWRQLVALGVERGRWVTRYLAGELDARVAGTRRQAHGAATRAADIARSTMVTTAALHRHILNIDEYRPVVPDGAVLVDVSDLEHILSYSDTIIAELAVLENRYRIDSHIHQTANVLTLGCDNRGKLTGEAMAALETFRHINVDVIDADGTATTMSAVFCIRAGGFGFNSRTVVPAVTCSDRERYLLRLGENIDIRTPDAIRALQAAHDDAALLASGR